MRIESYIQMQQLYPAKNTAKTTSKPVSSFSDKLQISSKGKDISVAKQALASTPDIREELVSSIKERVQNGTYEVSGEAFADKVLGNFYQTLA
ncbi:MAG: flagellar biosynthesis anti-sigma factor FlgM [Lachnospiraceae bacterium]|nr:flagellar biosynthesis anti-sigma factor FlgM [Lachnospiraceae bacterium]